MRRHPALHRLSREHSPALSLARRLMQAVDDRSAALACSSLRQWLPLLLQHFLLEEQLLLPTLQRAKAIALAARLEQEHLQLREQFVALRFVALQIVALRTPMRPEQTAARLIRTTPPSELAQLQQTGEQLRTHVHFEERELFPWLEQHVSADAFAQLADALTETEPS